MVKTLLRQGIKYQKQMRPCFYRGSTLTNLNNCDFASAGSQKIKNGQDLTSAGDHGTTFFKIQFMIFLK